MLSVQLSTHHMLFREGNGWLCLSSPSAKCMFMRIVTSFGSATPPPNCCFLLLRYECTNSNISGQHTHARKPSNLASENGINSHNLKVTMSETSLMLSTACLLLAVIPIVSWSSTPRNLDTTSGHFHSRSLVYALSSATKTFTLTHITCTEPLILY